MKKLWYLIFSLIGMAIMMPIHAAKTTRVGEYAVVRYVRRKGSTTEWKEGVRVRVIEEHHGQELSDGTPYDYMVIIESTEDIAFPTKEQLQFEEE